MDLDIVSYNATIRNKFFNGTGILAKTLIITAKTDHLKNLLIEIKGRHL